MSDVLSISAPSTPETRGSINAAALAKLPRGAIVVNTARGDLVNDDDLIAALKSGQVGYAGPMRTKASRISTLVIMSWKMFSCCRIWAHPSLKRATRWVSPRSTISTLRSFPPPRLPLSFNSSCHPGTALAPYPGSYKTLRF